MLAIFYLDKNSSRMISTCDHCTRPLLTDDEYDTALAIHQCRDMGISQIYTLHAECFTDFVRHLVGTQGESVRGKWLRSHLFSVHSNIVYWEPFSIEPGHPSIKE